MIVTLTDKSVNNVILRRKRLKIKVTNFPLLKKRDPNKDPKYPLAPELLLAQLSCALSCLQASDSDTIIVL